MNPEKPLIEKWKEERYLWSNDVVFAQTELNVIKEDLEKLFDELLSDEGDGLLFRHAIGQIRSKILGDKK